jgi:signal peptidase I
MFNFLLPAHVKKGKLILQGVKKFLHQNRDLMTEENALAISRAREEYAAVLETRDKERLEAEEKSLIKVCEKAVPNYRMNAVKENVEVIIVAIIVALGIRSYLIQPFKIPTASMQPTLNGIIGYPMSKAEPFPNVAKQAWDFVWSGSNYTELRAPITSGPLAIVSIRQQSFAVLASRTIVTFSNGDSVWCYAPTRQLFTDLWLPENGPGPFGGSRNIEATDSFVRQVNYPVTPGAVLARGRIDTGDQVLVDKVSYHFRKPTRGEVFVFSTKNITGIPMPEGVESQHYIKRLVGVPNDVLEIAPPRLLVNGQDAQEPGIRKVVGSEGNPTHDDRLNLYHGYTYPRQRASIYEIDSESSTRDGQPSIIYRLKNKEFMACGDNSGNSSDSRYWGRVPQENVVGPALMVYWPFYPHAGLIR